MKRPAAAHTGPLKRPSAETGADTGPLKRPSAHPASLTEDTLKRHEQIESLMANLKDMDDESMQATLGSLDQLTMMSLWKKFKMCRESEGQDQQYVSLTNGPGSQKKKQGLLRAWLKDGGQLCKHYRDAVTTFELKNTTREGYKWRSWKKTCDELGSQQALGMLKRGTLKWRKCPQDTKYMEFAVHKEEYEQEASKAKLTSLKASSSRATKEEDLAGYEELTLQDLKEQGMWGMEVVGQEHDMEDMELEPELKKFFHAKPKQEPKVNKWELASQVTSTTTKQELSKKLLSFKSELAKDQSYFQSAMVDHENDKKGEDYQKAQEMVKISGSALKQVEKALAAGAKKELAKTALVASLQAVQACKKNKGKKKVPKKESDSE